MQKTIRRVDTNYQGPTQNDAWPAFVPSAAVLVTTIDAKGRANILPLTGWGILSRFPFIVGIAVCQGEYTKNYFHRYSHRLLKQVPEFVLNIPHTGLREAITVCGGVSGDKADKWALAHLTPEPSIAVRPPAIADCPVSFECVVRQVVPLGSHDLFLGETVAVHTAVVGETIDEDLMTESLGTEGAAQKLIWRSLPVLE
jgi:flavin reductase (DIM6/NTAB) family NADH-FMN oxidoreductase RutF